MVRRREGVGNASARTRPRLERWGGPLFGTGRGGALSSRAVSATPDEPEPPDDEGAPSESSHAGEGDGDVAASEPDGDATDREGAGGEAGEATDRRSPAREGSASAGAPRAWPSCGWSPTTCAS